MTEYCYQSPGSGGLKLTSGQIAQFHVANIGNGNMATWTSLSGAEQRQSELNNARSGYRFVLEHLAMPSRLLAEAEFAVVSNWSNVGATPAYNPWNVTIQLRSMNGSVVWSGTSKLDVERFLPGKKTVTDTHPRPGSPWPLSRRAGRAGSEWVLPTASACDREPRVRRQLRDRIHPCPSLGRKAIDEGSCAERMRPTVSRKRRRNRLRSSSLRAR